MHKSLRLLLIVVPVVLLVGTISVGFYLYKYAGLKYYIAAVTSVNKLSGDARSKAESEFYGSGDNLHSGILAWTEKKGIWMWENWRLKFFKVDEFSIYSLYQLCTEKNLDKMDSGQPVSVGRSVSTDFSKWRESVKTGDYIKVIITNENMGGTVGNLREAIVNDTWVFVPVSVEKLCKN